MNNLKNHFGILFIYNFSIQFKRIHIKNSDDLFCMYNVKISMSLAK